MGSGGHPQLRGEWTPGAHSPTALADVPPFSKVWAPRGEELGASQQTGCPGCPAGTEGWSQGVWRSLAAFPQGALCWEGGFALPRTRIPVWGWGSPPQ